MFAPISRRKLFHHVATQIASAIETGAFRVGDELPSERDLMQNFAVGRPAVREALLLLEAQGLVLIHHGRRARVVALPRSGLAAWIQATAGNSDPHLFVENLKQVRLALEVGMAVQAAEVATKRDIALLTEALAANRRAISSRDEYLRTDISFHRAIAAITGNVIFDELSAAILGWLARFRVDTVHVRGANLLSHDEHAEICRAICAHDAVAAAAAMRKHQLRTHTLYHQLAAQHGAGSGTTSASADVAGAQQEKPRRKSKCGKEV